MSDWKVVVPAAIVNMVLNPSAEIAGNFVVVGGAPVVTLVSVATHDAFFGIYSYYVQIPALGGPPAQGMRMTLDPLAGVDHYITLRVRDWLGSGYNFTLSLNGAIYHVPVLLETYANWRLYGVVIPAAQAVGSVALDVFNQTGGAIDSLFDGIQVEIGTGRSTYCDGDREGCEWLGLPHGSRSQRSAVSRAGGLIRDLADDLNYEVGAMIATGMAPLDLHVDQYAILPGGQLNSIKVLPNIVSLPGAFMAAADRAGLHAWRQGLINALKPDLVPKTEEGAQPVLLRYSGAAVVKEIEAHYLSGLEANIDARFECSEDLAIRLLAPDPFWREIGESAQVLDTTDPATLRYATGRLRATGQWDALGLVNAPAGPANPGVYAIAIGPDKKVYFGGDFTGWNAVGIRDYLVRYNPQTAAWETVGGNNSIGGIVRTLAFGSDGILYIGGSFPDMIAPAVANTARFCAYDYTTNTFSALGNPLAGTAVINAVFDTAFESNGDIIIVGNFTRFGDIAGADYVVQWTGAAPYVLVGAAGVGTPTVRTVAIDSNDNIYIGGAFANWAADGNADGWAWYNGTAWASVNGIPIPAGGTVIALAITEDDLLYVGGQVFAVVNGVTVNNIFSWDGTSVVALGIGLVSSCLSMAIGPDGSLWIGGVLLSAGALAIGGIARWTESAWAYTDAVITVSPRAVFALTAGDADPVIPNNYDLWAGMDESNVTTIAGSAIVTHDGTNSVFPRITISRAAGTSAVIKQIRNETTGKELFINYSLLDGEVLTIILAPTEKSVVSSFFGSRPDAILANSDFGTFELLPGANQITCFVEQVGGVVVAAMIWRDTYWSFD